jgi:hypothetical protein
MCGVTVLAMGVLTPAVAHAQMFSVGSARDRVGKPEVAFHSGVEWMEFGYQGPDPRDAAYPDYSFDAPLLRMHGELGDLAIHAVFGRGMRSVNLSYTELGAELGSDYTVWRDRTAAVGFPIRLKSTYALVRSGESRTVASEFNQSTVGVGSGIFAQARVGRALRVRSEAFASFGFVANGINSDGGTMRTARWSTRAHVDGVFSRVGLGVGVDVRTRSYALDIRSLEYRATSVAITGAITF